MRPIGIGHPRSLLLLLLAAVIKWSHAGPVRFHCDPCLDRANYTIRAIVHGTSGDPFWQQVQAAMKQSARDMNIHFEMELREEYSPVQMMHEIWDSIAFVEDDSLEGHHHNVTQIDGLIVTVPDPIVYDAIAHAVEAGMHVFGLNVGLDVAEELGMMGFVGMDEYEAGAVAAREFLRRRDDIAAAHNLTNETTIPLLEGRALFVNNDYGSLSLRERMEGFNDTIYNATGFPVDEVAVEAANTFGLVTQISERLATCAYDFVLLNGVESVSVALDAREDYQCGYNVPAFTQYLDGGIFSITSSTNSVNSTSSTNGTSAAMASASRMGKNFPGGLMMMASFDSTVEINNAIREGQLEFTITQQQYLQGVLPVLLSTLFATTGKALRTPDDTRLYATGPHMITKEAMHSNGYVGCVHDAFPVCPNKKSPDGIGDVTCECFDRSLMTIAGIVHGLEGSQFWDSIFSAAEQAAKDIGVNLLMKRYKAGDAILKEMEEQIYEYCMTGITGIFVSIPSEVLFDAIQYCQLAGVPVISVNSGAHFSKELGLLHHIGQEEYKAGYVAGERLVLGGIRTGYCLRTELDNYALLDRCRGFADALNQTEGIVYGGMHAVPKNNPEEYKAIVEAAVGIDGNWDGVGLLVTSGSINPVLQVQTIHTRVQIATFDVVEELFEPLGDGRVLFTIDQQQFLQGSMPVYLLGYAGYTLQFLENRVVETGPFIVEYPPETEERTCEANMFEVCPPILEENMNFISDSLIHLGYAEVTCIGLISIISLVFLYIYRGKNVVRVAQPLFLTLMVIGAFMMALSIIPMGIQTEYRYEQDSYTGELTDTERPDIGAVDAACMAVHWLTGLGFAIVFSALFAKIIRVKRIYDAGKALKRKKVHIQDVLIIMAVIMFIEVTLLLCWQFISPSKWERENAEEIDGVLSSRGSCESVHSEAFYLAQNIFHVACFLFALVLCVQTRQIPTDFAESSWVLLCVLSIFQISVLAIPVGYMVRFDPAQSYFVRSIAIFLQTLAVLGLIIGPKMYKVFTGDDTLPVSMVAGRHTSTDKTIDDGRTSAATPIMVPIKAEAAPISASAEPGGASKARSGEGGEGRLSFSASVESAESGSSSAALRSALKPAKYGSGKPAKPGISPAPRMESLESDSDAEVASTTLSEELTKADETRAGLYSEADLDKLVSAPRNATNSEEKDDNNPSVDGDSKTESQDSDVLMAKAAHLSGQAKNTERIRERAIQSFDEDGKGSDVDETKIESNEQKEERIHRPSKRSRKKLDEANAQLVALATEISKTSTDFLRQVAKSLTEDSYSSLGGSKTSFLFGDDSERSMASEAKQPIYHAKFQDKINEFDVARQAFKSGLECQKQSDLAGRGGILEVPEDGDMYFM